MNGRHRVAQYLFQAKEWLLTADLNQFFGEMQEDFLAGRLANVARRLSQPLVVYSASGVTVLRGWNDVLKRVEMYREALDALSTSTGMFELVSEDSLINNRLRVTLRTIYVDHEGVEVTSSLSRYFLVRDGDSFLVEMIEYLEFPLPLERSARVH